MTSFKKTIIICFAIFGIIALALLLVGDREKGIMIGLSGLLLSILYLVVGVILCIRASSREVGKGMLISSGLLLIIGLSVCSVNPLNIK
ncbi:MAG: hypothetical protein H7X88_01455 [Gloeobacteraceae cyanobacterium ES-bin-316]|nr:hypothetical protein [Ferruginibacter sp.]